MGVGPGMVWSHSQKSHQYSTPPPTPSLIQVIPGEYRGWRGIMQCYTWMENDPGYGWFFHMPRDRTELVCLDLEQKIAAVPCHKDGWTLCTWYLILHLAALNSCIHLFLPSFFSIFSFFLICVVYEAIMSVLPYDYIEFLYSLLLSSVQCSASAAGAILRKTGGSDR